MTAAPTTYCPVCSFETTFQHDHKPDNTGLDDGPDLPTRKKPTPKPPEEVAAIRVLAWATRRAIYGACGNRKYGVRTTTTKQCPTCDGWSCSCAKEDEPAEIPTTPTAPQPITGWTMNLVGSTDVIVNEIEQGLTQGCIAQTYAMAIISGSRGVDEPDWATINRAIIARWSMSGLERIKAKAWKLARGVRL